MTSVTISPQYQIVIPSEIRKSFQLRPGQKMQVIALENRIELIPEKNIAEMRGFLRGINTTINRESNRL